MSRVEIVTKCKSSGVWYSKSDFWKKAEETIIKKQMDDTQADKFRDYCQKFWDKNCQTWQCEDCED